ncbi:MAG: hypothetical protein HY907_03375 [Deltaproteobacteria bacterium]|nr:hypothetical protein [Deltaproteobacteria bacterium]
MLVRLSASVSVALWSAFLPLALDLAHPVFSDCGSHRPDAASDGELGSVAAHLDTTPDDAGAAGASDSDCPVHGVPADHGSSCCGDGGCLCCGGLALLAPPSRIAPAPVRSAPLVFDAARLVRGVSGGVFRPPRS